MIYLEINGRLGNQMFQYAYARKLMKQTGNDLTISFMYFLRKSKNMKQNGWDNTLKYFNVVDFVVYDKSIPFLFYAARNFKQFICLFLGKIRAKINGKAAWIAKLQKNVDNLLLKNNICLQNSDQFNFVPQSGKNIILKGWFENPNLFSEIKDELLKEFIPKHLSEYATHLISDIQHTRSVCLSIRTFNEIRHDAQWFQKYNVCNEEYYQMAIGYFLDKDKDTVFYLFSDDADWVMKNYDLKGIRIVVCNSFDNSAESLYVMSQCQHFIISNSTFSWWGQYLSTNRDKLVICPKIWNRISPNSPLIDLKWILL